jgi:hypothetical protein
VSHLRHSEGDGHGDVPVVLIVGPGDLADATLEEGIA